VAVRPSGALDDADRFVAVCLRWDRTQGLPKWVLQVTCPPSLPNEMARPERRVHGGCVRSGSRRLGRTSQVCSPEEPYKRALFHVKET
jgi:hypothetical protein